MKGQGIVYVGCLAPTTMTTELIQQLRHHFSESLVRSVEGDPAQCQPDDVILVLIPKLAEADRSWDPNGCVELWIERALQSNITLIPVLDDASFPASNQLPQGIRGFLQQQWRNLESGPHYENDLGQLIVHIERRLPHRPDDAWPWDLWVHVVSWILVVLGTVALFQWIAELFVWPYGLERTSSIEKARASFEGAGVVFAIGCVMWALATWKTRVRVDRRRGADARRLGAVYLPPRRILSDYLSLGFGWAAIGIGWIAWIPMLILAMMSLARNSARLEWFNGWRLISFIAAVAGSALLVALERRVTNIASASGRCEQAIQALSKLPTGSDYSLQMLAFQDAQATASYLPQPYHGTATIHYIEATGHWPGNKTSSFALFGFDESASNFERFAEERKNLRGSPSQTASLLKARAEIEKALARYPARSRGFMRPNGDSAAQAYQLQSEILSLLGYDAEAQTAIELSRRVAPWLDLFAGLFRWWDDS